MLPIGRIQSNCLNFDQNIIIPKSWDRCLYRSSFARFLGCNDGVLGHFGGVIVEFCEIKVNVN